MKRATVIAIAVVATVLVGLTINTRAQDFNTRERTFLTFSGPIELPGMMLPAGTYTFRLADTQMRNVVQVLSQDEKQVYGQFLFVPTERPDATGETVVTFRETADGSTPAVHYWFYPGEKTGKEFVYPKDQATQIAARTSERVLTNEGDTSNPRVSSIDAQGNVSPWERQNRQPQRSASAESRVQGSGISNDSSSSASPASGSSAAAQPSAAAGSLAGNRGLQSETPRRAEPPTLSDRQSSSAVGTTGTQSTEPRTPPSSSPTASPAPESQVAARELPRTASPLPLTGLLGFFSLMGGLGLRIARARGV